MIVFVAGSGLSAVVGDQGAVGLRFIRPARTASVYRLYVVQDQFAALVEVEEGGICVLGELCDLDDARATELLANEPPGVHQRAVKLDDGTTALGPVSTFDFLPLGSRDISAFGGFAAYWASR
jgi:hypothetical protein